MTQLDELLRAAAAEAGGVVVLTGAGISAESGIPTFRGPEGYWTVGSREYHPQEMATHAMFRREPEAVWAWYLYRRGVCHAAEPNPGHRALVDLERFLGDRFVLVTQNVDGLHLRAGSTPARTYQVHGNIDHMRCGVDCGPEIRPVPAAIPAKPRGAPLDDAERKLLRCPSCGGWARPQILWFDECYDEEHFRYDSAIAAAAGAALLLVVGTSGSTTLPLQVGAIVARRGAILIDVNPEPNPFADLAEQGARGLALRGSAALVLPDLVGRWIEAERS